MVLAQQVHVFSPLEFFLRADVMPIFVGAGLVFAFWGLYNLVRPVGPGWILSQSLFSMFPAVGAVVLILAAYSRFAQLAMSEQGSLVDVAVVAGQAMSAGFFGIVSTVFPVLLGLFGLFRCCQRSDSRSTTEEV